MDDGAVVRDYGHGQRVIDRWREERPDLWCMLAIDGSPKMKARPPGGMERVRFKG